MNTEDTVDLKKPFTDRVSLNYMMATPGENRKIRLYIERLEERNRQLERENKDLRGDN